ncbi:MAG TPA: copper amine oxidase N-terminal domain-containing protein [Symbiobacteriaceae bacterium]|nr:copper amine oxidase N-terminal domain-containing protein [Symbiobacteriaceae bacterium]
MSRTILSVMLAALLVLTGTGGAAASPNVSGGTVTVSGRLEYVTNLSAPHYELAGYVLIARAEVKLDQLAGQDVLVVGTPVSGPSIYMRKTLSVESVMVASAQLPPPKDDGGLVTIPVIKEPPAPVTPAPVTPAPDDKLTVPAIPPLDSTQTAPAPEPVPLWGTPYYVLFGQVEATGTAHLLVQNTPKGTARISIRSSEVDLAALVGKRVGLVAARDPGIENAVRYHVTAAVVLTDDLIGQLSLGPIYTVPDRPIRIVLRGKELALDQQPILGNGRTLVPLRAIGEALGARVTWNESTLTATVALGDREVNVTVGSNLVVVRQPGKADVITYSDIAPVVAGGRTLVPVRVISESLGLKVGWNEATHTVTLD